MTKYFFLLFLISRINTTYAQKYEVNIEGGIFRYFGFSTIVEPGPGWRGYYLPREPSTGLRISGNAGIRVVKFILLGGGISLASVKGAEGIIAYGNIRFGVFDKKRCPFLYFSPGYSHFFNQYDRGTGTEYLEFGAGLKFRLKNNHYLIPLFGLVDMQWNNYYSLKVAYAF